MRFSTVASFALASSVAFAACSPPRSHTRGANPGEGGGGEGGSGGTNTGGASSASGSSGDTSSSNGSSGSSGAGGSGGCSPGLGDCNKDPSDGCETDISGSPDHCGTCDTICPSGANGTPTCTLGVCGFDCIAGKGDCNGLANDGCEANLNTSAQNCGMCGQSCMGAPCVQGACACAAQSQKADQIPLDLFIMLDQSGSMSDSVAGGGTKWTAVTTALKGFFNDPANAALGVGIQYFALPSQQACSPICATDADCGAFGPCIFNICFGCSGGGGDSCNVADYAKAEVPIAPLTAAHASALSNSINAHSPTTGTPTAPALDGAIQFAKSWKVQMPGHNVVVVFATDGDPQECNPQDIPSISNIAAAGVNGSPSIKTFVIGVGSSLNSMNSIAAAGGTGSAFLVDTNANVVQQFKAALQSIQATALGCEYTIPQPQMGNIDYAKVNVQYTPGNGNPQQVLNNVASAAACSPVAGGWYYDNNVVPTKIILCPASCDVVSVDPTGQIDILLGCATQHM